MKFVAVTKDNVSVYAAWFKDAELHRRLSSPTDEWLTYVTSGSNAQAWLCYHEGQALAHLQLDTCQDKTAYLALAVQPGLRGQGIATGVLKAFLNTSFCRRLHAPDARIEADNLASQRIFSKAGFIPQGIDEEGFHMFIYTNSSVGQKS